MKDADEILATGGPGMVKSAYSSGKPALGVGPGNTPVIIDDSADIKMAVNSIIHSKTFDNGMICASEQSVTVLDSIYEVLDVVPLQDYTREEVLKIAACLEEHFPHSVANACLLYTSRCV